MSDSIGRKLGLSAALAAGIFVVGAIVVMLLFRDGDGPNGDDADSQIALSSPENAAGPAGAGAAVAGDGADGRAAATTAGAEPEVEVASVEAPTGPISLQGVVSDAEGAGVAEARLFALDIDVWTEEMTAAMQELQRVNDPTEGIARLRERAMGRIDAHGVPSALSNEEGRYEFRGLPASQYRLFVVHPDYLLDAEHWALVADGETTTVDISLVNAYTIAGRVVDAQGEPVTGAIVTASATADGAQVGFRKMLTSVMEVLDGLIAVDAEPARSGDDGAFLLRSLQPVAYDLTVRHNAYARSTVAKVPAGTDGVVVLLERGVRLSGRVLDPSFAPVVGAEWSVTKKVDVRAMNNPLMAAQLDFDFLGESARRGTSGEGGLVEIFGLEAGKYALEVAAEGFPPARFDLEAAAEDVDLGDLLLDRGQQISGRVSGPDGRSVADARVTLIERETGVPEPLMNAMGQRRLAEAQTGADGAFSFELVPDRVFAVSATAADLADGTVEDVRAGATGVEVKLTKGAVAAGKVLDRQTREPIADATVAVYSGRSNNKQGTTDEAGVFEVRGIVLQDGVSFGPGKNSAYVQVSHPDYVAEGQALELRTDEAAPLEEILLSRGRLVRGVVVDAEGAPVPSARVRVEIPGVPSVMLMFGPSGGAGNVFSKRDGTFELSLPNQQFGPMANALEVVASHPSYASARVAVGSVAGNGDLEVELVLTPGVELGGRVTSTAGEPVLGARLTLQRDEGAPPGEAAMIRQLMPQDTGRSVYSGADGSYSFRGVEEGKYKLKVAALGYAARAIEPLEVRGDAVAQDVVLDAGGSITGRVVDSAGFALPGVEVVAFPVLEQQGEQVEREIRVMLQMTGGGSARTKTDVEGRYALDQLPEGAFRVVARGSNFQPAEVGPVEVGREAPDLVIRPFGALRVAVISGDTGRPMPRYTIRIDRQRAEGEDRGMFDFNNQREVGSPDGVFRDDALLPGTYTIAVRADDHQEAVQDVLVPEAGLVEAQIVVLPGARVTLVLRDATTGEAVAGAQVHTYANRPSEDGSTRSRIYPESHESDENGVVRLTTLSEGEYSVGISHAFYTVEEQPKIVIPEHEGKEVVCNLQQAGQIQGNLVGIEGMDPREVGFTLILIPIEEEKPAPIGGTGSRGEEKPAPRRGMRHHVWVNPSTGEFDQGGLQPGRYTVSLQQYRYIVEENGRRRRTADGPGQEIPLGEVAVRAGMTETVSLRMP